MMTYFDEFIYIYIYTWGALSSRKKCDIQKNLLFEDLGWKISEKLKYRIFCHFSSSRVLHTKWQPIPFHSKYVNLDEDIKRAIMKKKVDMSELNSHDGFKIGLPHFLCRN